MVYLITGPDPDFDSDKQLVFNDQNQADIFKAKITDLRCLINDYQSLPEEERHGTSEEKILSGMRDIGEAHPDPEERKKWSAKAEAFEKADDPEHKSSILRDVGSGLAIILATPFVLAGAVIVAAGAILYGVGSLVKGIGNALSFGTVASKLEGGSSSKNKSGKSKVGPPFLCQWGNAWLTLCIKA
jgi:hypothetical protein